MAAKTKTVKKKTISAKAITTENQHKIVVKHTSGFWS